MSGALLKYMLLFVCDVFSIKYLLLSLMHAGCHPLSTISAILVSLSDGLILWLVIFALLLDVQYSVRMFLVAVDELRKTSLLRDFTASLVLNVGQFC